MNRSMLFLVLLAVGCGAAEGTQGPDRDAQISMNESLALSRIKTVVAAEAQAQCLGVIDEDGDGIGEYAFLGELSGGRPLRAAGTGLKVPLLGKDFRNLCAGGFVATQGYHYRVYLPSGSGEYVGEARKSGTKVDVEGAEGKWICYAWPARHGVTGTRTFAVSQAGRITATDRGEFSGGKGPSALAASDGEAGGWRPVR